MITKKKAKKIASLVKRLYRCCGINVKLHLRHILEDRQRLIFQVIPEPGTAVDGIFKRADDIRAVMQIPLFRPFRKGVSIFLAVSTIPVRENSLLTMLNSPAFRKSKATLPIMLGYDLMGGIVIEDMTKIVHAMYVGATCSGKSIGLICLILSLICKHPVSEVNLIIFDIGAYTLDVLEDIPHLSHPIVKDRDEGIHVIQSLTEEMERRIDLTGSRICDLPAIVCVMDEYPSFIDSIGDRQQRQQVVDNISNLLRRGRKAKIHLVLSTQNPTKKTMATEIGNITTRMAFRVDRFQTSIAILNRGGAEVLPGNGAMLYQSREYPDPIYIQGAYISDIEVEQLVEHIKAADQDLSNRFVVQEFATSDTPVLLDIPFDTVQIDSKADREFVRIILWTLGNEEISVEKIKQEFHMGNRANGITDRLFAAGLISEKFSNQPRKVLPQSVGDVSDEVMSFLTRWGVPIEDVTAAISKRSNSILAIGAQALSEESPTV